MEEIKSGEEIAKGPAEPNEVISIEVKKYEELLAELTAAKKEAEGNYDKYLRSLADLENSKRRAEKEKSDTVKFCLERILRDLLPVLDSFDNAMSSVPSDGDEQGWQVFHQGITLVKKQLMETVGKHGLMAIEAMGMLFDPNLHQAIKRVESAEVSDEIVHEEFSRGYTLHGRLVRPAMVSVAIPKE